MNLQEFSKLAMVISSIFNMTFDEPKIKIWHGILQDIDYGLANKAIAKLAQTHTSFLTPAHIRGTCEELVNPKISTVDAITLINYSISNFGYYRSEEAMQWLQAQDCATYEIVKAVGFRNMCGSKTESFRKEFEFIHREISKEFREGAMLSGRLKSELQAIAGKVKMESLAMAEGEY